MLYRLTRDVKGFLLVFILLLCFWLLLSASFDWQHLLAGAVIAFVLTFIWSDTLFTSEKATSFNLRQVFRLFVYLVCLVCEIVKANLSVAYLVLHPRLPINPGFVIYALDLDKELPKTLYLNSITLTPGTITVDCQNNRVIVHCFIRDNADRVQSWYLFEQVKKIESGR